MILGTEIEVKEEGMGPAHLLAYFPTFASIRRFTGWLSRHMKNVRLSTQRLHRPARELQERVAEEGGLLIPAHVFTPFKSVYGSATDRMSRLLDMDGIVAVELGLSADASMADHLRELSRVSFVTNSDAHSLGKIGREYNEFRLLRPSFRELELALRREKGRGIAANYGLNPKLGKYYQDALYRLRRDFVRGQGRDGPLSPLRRQSDREGGVGPDRRNRRRTFRITGASASLCVSGAPRIHSPSGAEDP